MAFQSMMTGAECAVAVNPLHQVLKHSDRDQSLQKDRLAGPSNTRLQYLPSSSSSVANPVDLQMAQQFFNGGRAQEPNSRPLPQVGMQAYIPQAEVEQNCMEFPFQLPAEHAQAFRQQPWATEFGTTSSPNQRASPVPQTSQVPSQVQRPYYQTYGYGSSPYAQTYTPNYGAHTTTAKGKGKLTQEDFDAAFASFDQAVQDDGLAGLEEAFERQIIEDKGKGRAAQNDVIDFERVWNELQESDVPPPQSEMAKWEAEFNQLMNSERDDLDFTSQMEEQYKNLTREDVSLQTPIQFDEYGVPQLGEYVFESHNPLSSTPSPLERAKELLASNGSLSETSLLLEAAIQQSDFGEGGYEAWILLGETLSMDEKEEAAIRALQTGVEIAQRNGVGEGSRAGMISLAIAYTNESYEKASYTMLGRWLEDRFPGSLKGSDELLGIKGANGSSSGWSGRTMSTWAIKERVTDAYLAAARMQHAEGIADPDVQIGLGVLLYTGGDYVRAADCFQSALQARPHDYTLWNRYGSCLSNANKPEEALGIYREALNIRPTYTRAIYNVGVACLNIGAHKEAAEHLLSGLDHQIRAGNTTSEQLWSTLRRCLIVMDHTDWADLARPGTPLDTFRNLGFDF